MKTCRKCGIEKSIEDFHRKSSAQDGRRNECKSCVKEMQSNPRVIEIKRIAQLKYAHSEKGVLTEKRHAPKRQDRIKRLGRDKVYAAVRYNLTKKPCDVCNQYPAQAHHSDYSKPLDVKWLCIKHHAETHKELRSA